jgi:3-oxoadipate enol-lactonase
LEAGSPDRVELPPLRLVLRSLLPSRARRRARLAARAAPPIEPPAARTIYVAERGEFFIRDSGGDGPPVLLLHGWVVSADINWLRSYKPLCEAGYRVIAIDHRGHGRGLRTHVKFRLADCADDAAAVVDALGCGPVIAVGYSMGGPIAQLLAHRHPHLVRGIVLCATSCQWQEREFKRLWRTMWMFRILASVAPVGLWTAGLRVSGVPDDGSLAWLTAELSRGSPVALAEAGRELGRFDSRPWLSELQPPAAVVVTTRDISVPPRLQRALAEILGAPTFEVEGDHLVAGLADGRFNAALLPAIAHVGGEAGIARGDGRAAAFERERAAG